MSHFCTDIRIRSTRKVHRCCWCGEVIPRYTSAWHCAGRNESGFFSGHWHDECYESWQRLTYNDRLDLQDGWIAGEFRRGMTPSESGKAERAELEAERMKDA